MPGRHSRSNTRADHVDTSEAVNSIEYTSCRCAGSISFGTSAFASPIREKRKIFRCNVMLLPLRQEPDLIWALSNCGRGIVPKNSTVDWKLRL